MARYNYVDYAGLQEFLKKLKEYYAAETKDTRVGYAVSAGNASTANALAESRTIALTGDATGSASFDGSANASIAVTIAEASAAAKGLMSAAHYTKLDGLANIKSVGDKLSISDAGQLSVDLSTYATKEDITAVFKFRGTVPDKASLPTNATVGDVYHVIDTHSEYVWVGADVSDVPHPEAHWEELGLSIDTSIFVTNTVLTKTLEGYRKTSDKIPTSDIDGLEAYVKGTKVDAAGTADQVAHALKIKTPGAADFTSYNGSAEVSIDISSIATSDTVAKKADKLTAAGVGDMILAATADGNLASTNVNMAVLSGGSVAAGNASFVTGGTVADYVDPKISDLVSSAATYAFADGTNGQFTVTPTVGGIAQEAITVATGADANKIEVVKVDGIALAIAAEDKSVNIDLSAYAKEDEFAAIPTTGATNSIESLFA